MIRSAPSPRPLRGVARRSLDRGSVSGLVAAGLAILATGGIITSGILSDDRPLDLRTDCPQVGDPAGVNVVALDTTDRLMKEQPLLVERMIDGVVAGIPAGDRLAVAEIRNAGLEPQLAFNRCVPGKDSNVERNRFRNAVRAPVHEALEAMATRPEAARSPVVESLIALVDHPQLQPTRGRITIHLLSDGLQASDFATAYGDRPFPPVVNNLLSGVTIRLVVLHNPRDAARQRQGVERLVAWLRGSGARVEYEWSTWQRFEQRPR
jgi:hypothetical protein